EPGKQSRVGGLLEAAFSRMVRVIEAHTNYLGGRADRRQKLYRIDIDRVLLQHGLRSGRKRLGPFPYLRIDRTGIRTGFYCASVPLPRLGVAHGPAFAAISQITDNLHFGISSLSS